MGLAELTVENLRCWQHARMDLHPGHNLIWGSNACWKACSSSVEAAPSALETPID
jgi:recombinational DNA repair ATPase RecF